MSCEQTLSEATQQLPDTLKADHPDVSWREISGFRNILVHNYLGDMARNAQPCTLSHPELRQLARLFSQIVDTKSRFTQTHSAGVAEVARRSGYRSPSALTAARRRAGI